MKSNEMVRRAAFLILIGGQLLLLPSCLSRQKSALMALEEYPLQGMVYDADNQPCAAAAITVDGGRTVKTDIRGRFVLEGLPRGEHRLEVRKEGCEDVSARVDFQDRSQVVYLKVTTFQQLLREAEQALNQRRVQKAEELLARARKIDADDPVGNYLQALYLLETERPEEAVRVLDGILERGFREPVVYLSLADIHQYHLHDAVLAASDLREYLRLQKDPDVRSRLQQLEAAAARAEPKEAQ